jgi:hypothetical protein
MKTILALALAGLFAFSATAFAGPGCDGVLRTADTEGPVTTAEAPSPILIPGQDG